MPNDTTVLVCGGREFADWDALKATLDPLLDARGIAHVVTGGASGADFLAGEWAKLRGLRLTTYPADWRMHGKAAGPLRNAEMLRDARPSFVVAFPGGRGTADMIRRARAHNVEVVEVSR